MSERAVGYQRDDVLSPEQVRLALGVGETRWKTVRHRFQWSYLIGPKSARITWGAVLDTLAQHTADELATRRRRAS